MTALNTAI